MTTQYDNSWHGAVFAVAGGWVGELELPGGEKVRAKISAKFDELGFEVNSEPLGYAQVSRPVPNKPVNITAVFLVAGSPVKKALVLYHFDHPEHGVIYQIRPADISLGTKYDALRALAAA